MPAYNDTPQAAQAINTTQTLIQTNFSSLSTVNNVNHVAITDASDYGKHKFLQMPEQGASPTTAANEAAIFARQGALSSVAELCFRRESNGAVVEFTGGTLADPGWTRLPSGLLIKWGTTSLTTPPAPAVCTFPIAGTIPVFTSVFTVFVNPISITGLANVAVTLYDFSTTQFRAQLSQRTTTYVISPLSVHYLAIGV